MRTLGCGAKGVRLVVMEVLRGLSVVVNGAVVLVNDGAGTDAAEGPRPYRAGRLVLVVLTPLVPFVPFVLAAIISARAANLLVLRRVGAEEGADAAAGQLWIAAYPLWIRTEPLWRRAEKLWLTCQPLWRGADPFRNTPAPLCLAGRKLMPAPVLKPLCLKYFAELPRPFAAGALRLADLAAKLC